jgi:hypothetical protein
MDRGLSLASSLISEDGATDCTAEFVHSPVLIALLPAFSLTGLFGELFSDLPIGTIGVSAMVGEERAFWGSTRFFGVATGGLAFAVDSLGEVGFKAEAAT